jgi:hypothetical protein
MNLAGRHFELADNNADWSALTGLSGEGWVLVRPDGFVASRSDQMIKMR